MLDCRMTRKRLLIVTCTALLEMAALVGVARAQAYLPEDNLAYPVQVVVTDGGGTGFFVRRDRELFLVTARHVLFDVLNGQLVSREFTLRSVEQGREGNGRDRDPRQRRAAARHAADSDG